MQFKEVSFLIHSILTVLFIYFQAPTYFFMILAPILHYLILKNNSSCYQNHCKIKIERSWEEDRLCQICQLDQWIRMRHCYKCNQCIHKFDHHCVLMGICIGEFNHKYYLLFIYSYFINTVLIMLDFHRQVTKQVFMDEYGVEHLSWQYYFYSFSLIILYFNLFLVIYLTLFHTIFILNNETTWERAKRHSISYLKNLPKTIRYPFSQGYLNNIRQMFGTDPQHPIDWKIIR